MKTRWKRYVLGAALAGSAGVGAIALSGCSQSEAAAPGLSPKDVADALFAVMEADRTTYTRYVVKRSLDAGHVKPSEQWADENEQGSIPLPAQMFRMASERVAKKQDFFSYQLKSSWPVNKQNLPKTPLEKEGFSFIEANKGEAPFYGEEEIAGRKYFTAIYADVAVSKACTSCHNKHPDSPRNDFKLEETMGGVVVRIPLDPRG